MVNKVFLIGNLAADPEVKATPKGTYLGKDEAGNSKEETEFHRLVAFGKLAEFAGQYLQKGRAVYAEGRLRTNKWEDSAGQKHSRTEVVLSDLVFVGHKPKEAAA